MNAEFYALQLIFEVFLSIIIWKATREEILSVFFYSIIFLSKLQIIKQRNICILHIFMLI